MKPFALNPKTVSAKKMGAIGACLAALAAVEFLAPGHSATSMGMAPVRLLVVLGCFCGVAWWLLRKLPNARGTAGTEPALKVVSKTGLGPKNGLALVEADGIRVLVAYGDGFARVLPLDPVGAQKENAS